MPGHSTSTTRLDRAKSATQDGGAAVPCGGVKAAGSCGREPADGAAACPTPQACLRLPQCPHGCKRLLAHSQAAGRDGRTPAHGRPGSKTGAPS